MNRSDFEAIRNLPEKTIDVDIRFVRKQDARPLLTASGIEIKNSDGVPLLMNVNYNPAVGSKTVNVVLAGEGAICRLDVDGTSHRDAGRCHKHSVQDAKSVLHSLRDGVVSKPELTGKSMREVFETFCASANIVHTGDFVDPEGT